MSTLPWLVIPLRSLAGGKSRLAGVLDADARRRLNAQFLDHLLCEAREWPGLAHTVVLSRCDLVLERARRTGALTLRQAPASRLDETTSRALNAGLEAARAALAASRPLRSLLVVSCDLPLARSHDMRHMAEDFRPSGGEPHVVLARDRAGQGTNALYVPCAAPLPFCFGAGSAGRHIEAARRLRWPTAVVDAPGLAFDIDTPADYCQWRRLEEMTL